MVLDVDNHFCPQRVATCWISSRASWRAQERVPCRIARPCRRHDLDRTSRPDYTFTSACGFRLSPSCVGDPAEAVASIFSLITSASLICFRGSSCAPGCGLGRRPRHNLRHEGRRILPRRNTPSIPMYPVPLVPSLSARRSALNWGRFLAVLQSAVQQLSEMPRWTNRSGRRHAAESPRSQQGWAKLRQRIQHSLGNRLF